jgi:ATP-dependent DNA helicase RecG
MNKNDLAFILQEGEGYCVEFKEALSGLDREMVAFANASGGKILVGVADDKTIKGIPITSALKSQIQDIANNCQPPVRLAFDSFDNILIVDVHEGEDKPYKCSSGFFIRVGPNAQKLDRDEIVAFIKSEGKVQFDEMISRKFDPRVHFSKEKLARVLKLAGISSTLGPYALLVNLGVAEKQQRRLIFNNAGVLFFAKRLADIYLHTEITCALYKGTEKVNVLDRKDFNEDILTNIDQAMIFLKQHIPVRYEMTGGPRRREVTEIPMDALREALINAVVHRDYFERGARVMVEIFDNRIEISSPGALPKGLKKEDFGKKSVLRNPILADLLNRVEYIEKMGTGIRKIRDLMKRAGLSPVKFEFTAFVTAIFRRPGQVTSRKSAQQNTPQATPQVTPQAEAIVLALEGDLARDELQSLLKIKDREYFRKAYLKSALEAGLIEMTIPDKPNSRNQKYRLTKAGLRLKYKKTLS